MYDLGVVLVQTKCIQMGVEDRGPQSVPDDQVCVLKGETQMGLPKCVSPNHGACSCYHKVVWENK